MPGLDGKTGLVTGASRRYGRTKRKRFTRYSGGEATLLYIAGPLARIGRFWHHPWACARPACDAFDRRHNENGGKKPIVSLSRREHGR